MATERGYYIPSQTWWYKDETRILGVFLMMQSKETMKWKSAGWTRYAKYSAAKTIGEAFSLGATKADIRYQVERGNMTLDPPTKAAARVYDADRARKRAGAPGFLDARRRQVDAKKPLADLENSPEACVAAGKIIEHLGAVHADAGLRGIKRATAAMPCFTLTNAAGDTIHSTSHEGHEQLVATWCVSPDDCVLEIGGGVGAVSTMLQKVLRRGAAHVVVEPQAGMCETLEENKRLHASAYAVARGALARGPVYSASRLALDGPDSANQRQWMFNTTVANKSSSNVRVPSLSIADVRKLAPQPFTALIVDCEGAFPQIVDDFPDVLDGIRVVYLERDGPPKTDYARADAALEAAGLALVLAASKHRVYVKATAAQLAKRDVAKARRLNNRTDAKTAASYRSERAAAKKPAGAAAGKRKRGGKPAPSESEVRGLEDAAVGRKVRVYWPDDSAWYAGEVVSFSRRKRVHGVAYDDGEREDLDLSAEKFEFLDAEGA